MSDDSPSPDAPPRMARAEAVFAAMCSGAFGFAVAFVLPFFTGQPVPWYYPVERRWAFESQPTGLAMDFYGRIVLGVIGWSIAVIVTLVVTRRFAKLGDRTRGLLIAWAITAIGFAILYFTWSLYFRIPTPVPLPAGYTPR